MCKFGTPKYARMHNLSHGGNRITLMRNNTEQDQERHIPLFSRFLMLKRFSILFAGGVLSTFAWIYAGIHTGNEANTISGIFSFLIFVFMAPYVLHITKGIFNDFKDIFERSSKSKDWETRVGLSKSARLEFLFSDNASFERYRKNVAQMLYNKREKSLALGMAFLVILPLTLLQDYQRGVLNLIFSEPYQHWIIIAYFYQVLYWALVYSILLSIVWMIMVVVKALLGLDKQRPHLHITKSTIELNDYLRSKKIERARAKMGLLDLSLRTLKAGLSPIVDFVFSSSLKIAFVGAFSSFPALFYFLTTKDIVFGWYALCIFSCLLSIAVFGLGQFGAWRLWTNSKKNALLLLDHIYAIRANQFSKRLNPHEEKIIKEDVEFLHELSTEISQLTATTYTSSSFFKLLSVNFLSFGPILAEQILLLLYLSK